MKLVFDFTDGRISRNITRKLLEKGAGVISALSAQGLLRELPSTRKFPFYCYLQLEHIEEYAQIADTTVGYFLFDSEESIVPEYTPYDERIINCLNALTEEELVYVQNLIRQFYPCEYPYLYDHYNCNQRLALTLRRVPHGGLSASRLQIDPNKKWYGDLRGELDRLRGFGYQYMSFHFNSEAFLDIATFAGVSIHWVLKLTKPLFCQCAIGDMIFDHYTFLEAGQQRSMCCFLENFVAERGGENG